MYMGFGFFDFGFAVLIPILTTIFFIVVIGVIIATMVRNIKQWNKNNNSPV